MAHLLPTAQCDLIGSSRASSYDSSVSSDDGEAVVRHRDLWFLDGSVVLQAENMLFRVHKSQLSRRSALFRDLFSLPQPDTHVASSLVSSVSQGDQQMIDGCPVLFLQDTADDLTNLLNAIYDGPTFGKNDRKDFQLVSGLLRLSSKYLVDRVRDTALAHLQTAWPSTLRGWDAREDNARSFELETCAHRGFRYSSPVTIINLAREIDAPELLPCAFYDLSRYRFRQIYESDEEGPLATDPQTLAESLSPADMQRLALGKEEAQSCVAALIQSMANIPHRTLPHLSHPTTAFTHHRHRSSGNICASPATCRKEFAELVDLATQHYLIDKERGSSDPLYVAEELGQLKGAEFSECRACARSLEMWAAKERERVWKQIPAWFRLDGW